LTICRKWKIIFASGKKPIVLKRLFRGMILLDVFSNGAEIKSVNNIKLLIKKGLSIRQISRLTGVSFGVVRKFY